jgi:hypothetical protein
MTNEQLELFDQWLKDVFGKAAHIHMFMGDEIIATVTTAKAPADVLARCPRV